MEMTITATHGPAHETDFLREAWGVDSSYLQNQFCNYSHELFEQSQCWTSNVGYFAKFLSKEKKSTIGLALVAQWTDPAFYLN